MEKNYYNILEIKEDEKTLSNDKFLKILKSNYKRLARTWHPDKFATKSEEERKEAEEKFKEITEAYNTLSDETKRQQYDFSLNGGGGFNPFEDIDPFSFFRNRNAGPRVVKGQNIQIEVEIVLKEAYNGGEKKIKYNASRTCGTCNGTGSANGVVEKCPHCNGTGMITETIQRGYMTQMTSHPCHHCNGTGKKISKPCSRCNGRGMETVSLEETIKIPKGVTTGQYVVMHGKGCEAPKNTGAQTVNGDLIIVFNVIDDGYEFVREGDNLIKHVKLNIFDGLLGTDVKIICIDDKEITINIPELTEANHIFTIKGKGMPNPNNSHVGDMKVIINYEMPKSLSNKQRELIKKAKEK